MCDNDMHDVIKLDIGCGTNKKAGFIGIDKSPKSDADILRDIERGLPFCDNSVSEIHCSQTLEHIQDLIFVMNEFWRVCKPGAKIYIDVPYYNTPQAVQDPTHVRFFSENSWTYFCEGYDWNVLKPLYGIKAKFKIVKQERVSWMLITVLEVIK